MRISIKQLEARVTWLNEITDMPVTSYTRGNDGKLTANIGNYHISGAYGGYALHRMSNKGGGVSDVLQTGHIPKKELFNLICAYMAGIEAA